MKMRSWTILLLTGLLVAWAVPAFAATTGDDKTRVLREPDARGAILEVTVLDPKGRPVQGAQVTGVSKELLESSAVTNNDGLAVLDGLPTESKGTVTPANRKLRPVNWDITIEHGRINYLTVRYNVLCYGVNPRKYRNPLVVKLPTEQPRFEKRWAPVSYVGRNYPVKRDRFLDDNWQQLTYTPSGRGQITQAYFRPWGVHEGEAEMPKVRWWHISVYSYVNCDKPVRFYE